MKTDLSDADLEKIIKALDWYYLYMLGHQREDNSYRELAKRLKKKKPQRETRTAEPVKKRG